MVYIQQFLYLLTLYFHQNCAINDLYTKSYRDRKLVGYKYRTATNLDRIYCVWECSNDEKCCSINHNEKSGHCELSRKIDPGFGDQNVFVDAKGWFFYEKKKLPVSFFRVESPDLLFRL